MFPLNRSILIALGVCLFIAPHATAQCVFTDDSFENVDIDPNTNTPVIPLRLVDWGQSDPSPVTDVQTADGRGPRTGTYYLSFEDSQTLFVEQSILIPLAADATLTYFAKALGAGTGDIAVLVDGEQVHSIPLANIAALATDPANGYTDTGIIVDISRFADGKSHTVRLQASTSGSGTALLVDDICITTRDAFEEQCPDNVLEDSSFEDGGASTAWSPTSAITQNAAEARIGQWYAKLSSGASIAQTFTFPAQIGHGLSFYLQIPPSSEEGKLTLFIDGDEVDSWDQTDQSSFGAYRIVALDLTPYVDADPHSIRFESVGALEFRIDDVCITTGGGGCASLEWTDSRVLRISDLEEDRYVGNGQSRQIRIVFDSVFAVCATQMTFWFVPEGNVYPNNRVALEFVDVVDNEVILLTPVFDGQFIDGIRVEGLATIVVDGDNITMAPGARDTFVIDTIAPVVAPDFVITQASAADVLDWVQPQLAATGGGIVTGDLRIITNDNTVAALPAIPFGPLPGFPADYTPADVPTPADRAQQTYAPGGRSPRVFLNVQEPTLLIQDLQVPFYDPPYVEGTVPLTVAGFANDLTTFRVLSEGATAVLGFDGAGDNYVIAQWQNVLQSTTASTSTPALSLTFTAVDLAGNATNLVLNSTDLWWLREVRAQLTPNRSGFESTPDQVSFNFQLLNRPQSLAYISPVPIYTFRVFPSTVQGPAGIGGPYDALNAPFFTWQPWSETPNTPAFFFQDLVNSNPGLYADRDYLIVLLAADEAGNVQEWPADLDPTVADFGDSWQRFFIKAGGTALDTTIAARFWHNKLNPLNEQIDGGEVDFGSATILPYPPNDTTHRLEVTFTVTGIYPPTAQGFRYILMELEDLESGLIMPASQFGPLLSPTVRITLPLYFNDPSIVFGTPSRVKEYSFRAAAQLVDDPNVGTILAQDPTPAVFRFRVVPGTVQDYLESMADPQDQPIRETQRLE